MTFGSIKDASERFSEVITDFKHSMNQKSGSASKDIEQSILQMLKRRPCTDRDIATALSLHSIEAAKIISHLVRNARIERRHQQGKNYYTINVHMKGVGDAEI